MTSQPIRLSTNFMTLIPSLTFTDYEWFPWSICNGCGMPAGNAYPSGHLVPSPILGLANAPIVETKFLELAMSLLVFSPRIPLGTFSILLIIFETDFTHVILVFHSCVRQILLLSDMALCLLRIRPYDSFHGRFLCYQHRWIERDLT